jgi:hypothetical protein
VFAFVVCRGPRPTGDTSAFVKELRDWVTEQLGAIARPDDIRFADNLPKTRSGKIMRRLLKTVARGEEITQDVSTLENPAILDQLRGTDGEAAPAATSASGGGETKAASKPGAQSRQKSAPQAAVGRAAGKTAKKTAGPAKKAVKKSAKKVAKKAAKKTAKKAAGRKPAAKTTIRRAAPSKRSRARASGRPARAKSAAKSALKRPLRRRGG